MRFLLILFFTSTLFISCKDSKQNDKISSLENEKKILTEVALKNNASLELNWNNETYQTYFSELQNEKYMGLQIIEAVSISDIVKIDNSTYEMTGFSFINFLNYRISLTSKQYQKIIESDNRIFKYCIFNIIAFEKSVNPEENVPDRIARCELIKYKF